MVTLTDSARDYMKKVVSDGKSKYVYLSVKGGGCSGFQYDFSIDQSRSDDDIVFHAYGVEVVVDDMSLELIDHAELDYVQDLMGSYFAVTNPNATASCGCGTSFSV